MSNAPVNQRTIQGLLILVLAISLGVSLIATPYPKQQSLQHTPTVIAILLLGWAAMRGTFSNVAFTCLVSFMLLHVMGARYIYSFVPFGESLHFLALEADAPVRNHYDRLVHLAFGILAMCPLVESAVRHGGLSIRWARIMAVQFVFGMSAFYETFEWLLTLTAGPEEAEIYNGQQGDTWDAQKDMALAMLGALALAPLVKCRARANPNIEQ